MSDEELASLEAISEAAWKWLNTKGFDESLDRTEWRLVEAVEALREIKGRQRAEREGR